MAGLTAAKRKGNIGGKPKGSMEDAKQTVRLLESLHKNSHGVQVIAKKLILSRTTVYKYLKYRGGTFKAKQ